MRNPLTFTCLLIFSFAVLTQNAYAQGMFASNKFTAPTILRPFGGKVTATVQPGVTCAAQYGVITITPVGPFPPTPYVIPATTQSVTIGSWILGLHTPTIAPGLCYTDSAPPVPYPTFNIIRFGASRGFSF